MAIKVSQVVTFTSEIDVNKWLKRNPNKDIINISLSFDSLYSRYVYLVHYKQYLYEKNHLGEE